MAEHQLPKLSTGVRFSSPAPRKGPGQSGDLHHQPPMDGGGVPRTCQIDSYSVLVWRMEMTIELLSTRAHRGLDQRAPDDEGDATVIELDQQIRRTTTCHGLINEYRPAA